MHKLKFKLMNHLVILLFKAVNVIICVYIYAIACGLSVITNITGASETSL